MEISKKILCCLIFVSTVSTESYYEKSVNYLKQYGFLFENQTVSSLSNGNNTDDLYTQAIINFQDFYNLNATGILDDYTKNLMEKSRCGVKDNPLDFTLYRKWPKNIIKWKFLFPKQNDKNIAKLCFDEWSRHTKLTFIQDENSPDITISYGKRKHKLFHKCEGYGNCIMILMEMVRYWHMLFFLKETNV